MNKEKDIIIDPNFEEVKFKGYYFVKFYCSNCNDSSGLGFNGVEVMIKKGKKKPKSIICPNCECLQTFI